MGRLDQVKMFVLDMDGTIYLGERLSHWWAVLAPWGKEET